MFEMIMTCLPQIAETKERTTLKETKLYELYVKTLIEGRIKALSLEKKQFIWRFLNPAEFEKVCSEQVL